MVEFILQVCESLAKIADFSWFLEGKHAPSMALHSRFSGAQTKNFDFETEVFFRARQNACTEKYDFVVLIGRNGDGQPVLNIHLVLATTSATTAKTKSLTLS